MTKKNQAKADDKPVPESPGEKVAGPVSVAMVIGVLAAPFSPPLARAVVDRVGAPLAGLLWLVALVFVVAAVATFWRYISAVKGAVAPTDSAPHRHYQALRDAILEGGRASQIYSRWLTRLLDAVDRFFGDAGHPASAWQRRCFSLTAGAPLWSALAYDRCLLLALVYPFGVIVVAWTVSGHVGPAEQALGFNIGAATWRRALLFVPLSCVVWVMFTGAATGGWRSLRSLVAIMAYPVVVIAVVGAGAGVVAVAVAMTVAVAGVVAGAGGIAGAVAGAGAVALAVGGAGADAVAVAVAVAFAFPVLVAGERSREQGRLATFELLFTMLCFAVCLALVLGLGASPGWRLAGPLLMFFGLLTLVNAPFDWLSLGLTRGLLRRGLELGGAWPWVLALVDGLLSTVLVVLLSAAMVLAVQLFDALAVHRGGKAVLPLEPLFDALAANSAAPEHWWTYALLATTLLPSLVNAVVGCASWLRSLPWLNLWLQRQMPARQGSAAEALVYHRVTVAAVLTSQWALGAVIGAVALPLWVWVWLVWLMPFAGPNLMELMRALAEQHWPQRLIAAWL